MVRGILILVILLSGCQKSTLDKARGPNESGDAKNPSMLPSTKSAAQVVRRRPTEQEVVAYVKENSGMTEVYKLVGSTSQNASKHVAQLRTAIDGNVVKAQFGEPDSIDNDIDSLLPTQSASGMVSLVKGDIWHYGTVKLFVQEGSVRQLATQSDLSPK